MFFFFLLSLPSIHLSSSLFLSLPLSYSLFIPLPISPLSYSHFIPLPLSPLSSPLFLSLSLYSSLVLPLPPSSSLFILFLSLFLSSFFSFSLVLPLPPSSSHFLSLPLSSPSSSFSLSLPLQPLTSSPFLSLPFLCSISFLLSSSIFLYLPISSSLFLSFLLYSSHFLFLFNLPSISYSYSFSSFSAPSHFLSYLCSLPFFAFNSLCIVVAIPHNNPLGYPISISLLVVLQIKCSPKNLIMKIKYACRRRPGLMNSLGKKKRQQMANPGITLRGGGNILVVIILLSVFIWQGWDTVQKYRDGKTSLQVFLKMFVT